jgi:hypothetical protein
MLHATVRTAILKHPQCMGLLSSKISLIVLRLIEIGYGVVLRTHSLLKNQGRRSRIS